MDAETEQVKTTAVTETLTALTSLEIAGVRPNKQVSLTCKLTEQHFDLKAISID